MIFHNSKTKLYKKFDIHTVLSFAFLQSLRDCNWNASKIHNTMLEIIDELYNTDPEVLG